MPNGFAGMHHVAINTNDLDRTLAFYRDTVGLDVSAVADSVRGRHAFVHLEDVEQRRPGLHFWEQAARQPADVEANRASFNSGPGIMAHLALYLPDPATEAALRSRLDVEHIEVTDIEELGTFAFWDPNGIMVEIVPARHDELHQGRYTTETRGRGASVPAGEASDAADT